MVCLLWIGFGVRDDLREDDVFQDLVQERVNLAKASRKEVHIGVVGDWDHHGAILQGVEVAAEAINAQGGILGRTIVLDTKDDQGTIEGALGVAQTFASSPEMPFVIGHTEEGLNAAVAQNYEFYGLLRISPNTSDGSASRNAFSLLFENGPPPQQTGEAILALAKEKGWTRLGLLYAKNDHAMRQARRFESMANKHGVQVPLSYGYKGYGTGISMEMGRWNRELDLEAMVLAVHETDIVDLVSGSRGFDIGCPFIVVGERPAALTPQKAEELGEMHFIEPTPKGAAYRNFSTRFQDRFHHLPSTDALLGYDALSLLAKGIIKAKSFVPATVAAVLKDSPVEGSLSGTIRFDAQGTAVKHPPRFISQ